MSDMVVGIDLGTTNSEIAAFVNGKVKVIGPETDKMLPSCVGLSPAGALLVGREARHQQLLYPHLTIRSIKRKMGSTEAVKLGDKEFTPQEISSLILRQLVEWAQHDLNQPIGKVVITVPAYFSDAQRNATREAGELAGLEVVRILNEPSDAAHHTAMVYDLGGGTFDVSIVSIEGDVTEVLASHGNNQLGGDDFDNLLLARLEREFQSQHGIDLEHGHPVARARLSWAAEEAKKKLSFEPYARVREEALVSENGKPLNLDVELSRLEYEEMIRPLVESTLDSVSKALSDAHKGPSDIDAILLVGGSTRTPLIYRRLQICAWPSVRESWLLGWPATMCRGCWWMSRPFPSARRTWENAGGSLIRIAITPSFIATPRCRSRVRKATKPPARIKPRCALRSIRARTTMRSRISSWAISSSRVCAPRQSPTRCSAA